MTSVLTACRVHVLLGPAKCMQGLQDLWHADCMPTACRMRGVLAGCRLHVDAGCAGWTDCMWMRGVLTACRTCGMLTKCRIRRPAEAPDASCCCLSRQCSFCEARLNCTTRCSSCTGRPACVCAWVSAPCMQAILIHHAGTQAQLMVVLGCGCLQLAAQGYMLGTCPHLLRVRGATRCFIQLLYTPRFGL
jgi:hypothetical protein